MDVIELQGLSSKQLHTVWVTPMWQRVSKCQVSECHSVGSNRGQTPERNSALWGFTWWAKSKLIHVNLHKRSEMDTNAHTHPHTHVWITVLVRTFHHIRILLQWRIKGNQIRGALTAEWSNALPTCYCATYSLHTCPNNVLVISNTQIHWF